MSNTDLRNLPSISDNNKLAEVVNEIRTKTICLVPEMLNFKQPELKLGLQVITVNLEKDAYKVDGGKYSLHLSKLNEIAQASGVIITDSRELSRENDSDGRATFIKHQIRWQRKDVDGSMKSGVATGEYNYKEDCARFVYKKDMITNGKKWASKGELMASMVDRRRNHAGALAESNGLARAIYKAIGRLPQTYDASELSKPFVVPCVIEDVSDLLDSDPEFKRMYVAKKLGILGEIYGGNKSLVQQTEPNPNLSLPSDIEPVEQESEEERFDKLSLTEKVNELEELIKEKQFKRQSTKSLGKYTDEKLCEFYTMLKELPTPENVL